MIFGRGLLCQLRDCCAPFFMETCQHIRVSYPAINTFHPLQGTHCVLGYTGTVICIFFNNRWCFNVKNVCKYYTLDVELLYIPPHREDSRTVLGLQLNTFSVQETANVCSVFIVGGDFKKWNFCIVFPKTIIKHIFQHETRSASTMLTANCKVKALTRPWSTFGQSDHMSLFLYPA